MLPDDLINSEEDGEEETADVSHLADVREVQPH